MKKALYTVAVAIIVFELIKYNPFGSKLDSSGIKGDTITIIKYLPSKSNEFIKTEPKPIYITKYIDNSKEQLKLLKQLETKYNKTADNNILLRELIQARQNRTYKETFKDSVLDAEISIYTSGKLDSLKFKYKTLPVKIKEKHITKYITPKFRVLAGVNGTAGTYNTIGVNLGLQTKKGNIYALGINSNTDITFDFKLSLFDGY